MLVAGIGLIDYKTGPDYGVELFYLVPVVACGIRFGAKSSITMALAASISWLLADVAGHNDNNDYLCISLWNFSTGLILFVSVGVLTARLRSSRETLTSLNERLQRLLADEATLARTDPLTGLQNRRGFREAVELEIARAHRQIRPMCLAYIDIDNFKNINDRHGHAVGDELLAQIATALRETIRAGDLPARLGGDEFGILFIGLSLTDSQNIAERILEHIRELAQRFPDCGLGASIGLAYFDNPPDFPDDLLVPADTAMYQAKDNGKAQVVVWQSTHAAKSVTYQRASSRNLD
ncbi:MAG: GGDEF domain-containing protein [Deltaproteobacteria bacterium]|nr:GGDEF domain-containing protein [Deltaproteobacteria bacterium]